MQVALSQTHHYIIETLEHLCTMCILGVEGEGRTTDIPLGKERGWEEKEEGKLKGKERKGEPKTERLKYRDG